MSVKYIFSTLLLIFVVALLGVRNYEVWTRPVEVAAENGPTRKQGKDSQAAPMAMGSQRGTNSIASYILIAEKNIFNPERKDFPVAPVEQNESRVRPQVILHGVTIAGDYQAASITNPGRPLRKGERETLTVKIGEKIGEYKLSKVLPDRIILEDSNDSFEVLLYDPKMPKKRTPVQAESKPAAATTTSPPAQGSAEASKTISPREVQGGGRAPGRAAAPLTPPTSTKHGQEKTSAPPLPSATPSPLPPPTASSLPAPTTSPSSPPTATSVPPPPAPRKLDPLYPTKIPVQGAPGK